MSNMGFLGNQHSKTLTHLQFFACQGYLQISQTANQKYRHYVDLKKSRKGGSLKMLTCNKTTPLPHGRLAHC